MSVRRCLRGSGAATAASAASRSELQGFEGRLPHPVLDPVVACRKQVIWLPGRVQEARALRVRDTVHGQKR